MPLVPIAKPYPDEILRLLDERGWSMAHFGRMLGRHPGSIWNISQGKENVSEAFIRQMAGALGVKPSQISDMEDDDTPAMAS